MLAVHAITATSSLVTKLKKYDAVALLTPISKRSREGRLDCTKNMILTIIKISR